MSRFVDGWLPSARMANDLLQRGRNVKFLRAKRVKLYVILYTLKCYNLTIREIDDVRLG